MKLWAWLTLFVSVFGICLVLGSAARQWTDNEAPAAQAKLGGRGELLYTMHCARCHGDEGRGDAEGAEKLIPPPRNFASRPWRFEPTAASIERVIAQGIPGTSMPAFGATLLDADIESLTAYALVLANAETSLSKTNDLFSAARFTAIAPRNAPSLSLEGAAGEKLTLPDLHGKVVLLNFWGSSCEHCLAKMPQLERLQQRFADQQFTAVNICADEDDAVAAQQSLSAAAPTLTTYVDPTGLANGRYDVSLMPTIWLLDQEGRLIAKAQGARDWNDPALAALIDSLLAP